MASLRQAVLLVLVLLQASVGRPESAEDRELENLLDELQSDSVINRESQASPDDRGITDDKPNYTHRDKDAEFITENMIDNVDHMEKERKLSGLGNIPYKSTTEDDSIPFDKLYEPVGCFSDHGGSDRPLPVLLGNLRPHIDWYNLNRTIRACARLAKDKGFRYFGVQFYGECWSGPAGDKTYDKDGSSDRCVAGVGKTWANFVYRFKEDECSNYIELNSAERSENHGPGEKYTCDVKLAKAWYRFTGQAGTHMAATCVPRFHCGTHAPGWMTGTLPRVAEGVVNRTICYNWRNDCCYWKSDASVKNCGGFYVYRLQKPPYCRLKYCGSSSSDKKRTIASDTPDITTNGLLESELAKADGLDDESVNLKEKRVSEPLQHEDTEMDVVLGQDSDEALDEYEPVGCYHDRGGDERPLPILLANLRPKIDWRDLNKTIRACASLAEAKGYAYFGIQYYGECWSGPNADKTYNRHGSSVGCVSGVGTAKNNFVYRFVKEEKTTVSPITTVAPLPDECSNYRELKNADRSENVGPSLVYTCDNRLAEGWYRFTGQAGTHMATTCVPKLHCGTHAPGWMTGTLPRVAEGAVNRTICFNWRNDCCYWETKALVRNCGEFYVYGLQPPPLCRLRYCGSNEALPTVEPSPPTPEPTTTARPTTARPTTARPTTARPTTTEPSTVTPTTNQPSTARPTEPAGEECTTYSELDSADRSENYGPSETFECDKTLSEGWYRFTEQAGSHMATRCPSLLHCGTHAPGWMNGTLPSVAEGAVERTVCFNWQSDCCHYKTSVLVRNCGGFYVYRLVKTPFCRLRYCGSSQALPTTAATTIVQTTTLTPTTTRSTTVRPTTKKPMPINTFRLCEHRSGTLRCPSGQKIKIRYANYGRTEGRRVCAHPSIRTTKCYSSVAANLVRCACNGHNSCPLYAKNQVYGDPCVGTFKYIEVKYQCVVY